MCTLCVIVVPGMGNTSPKDMDALLPLMNMVIYSIDKVKKLRLNREVSRIRVLRCLIVHSSDHSLIFCIFLLLHSSLKYSYKSLFHPPCIFRANWKLTETGPVWRRTSWSRLTLSARRQPRHAGRRRREPRRRGSWMRRTLRDNAVWRSEIGNAARKKTIKQIAWHFGKTAYSLSRCESDDKIDNIFLCILLFLNTALEAVQHIMQVHQLKQNLLKLMYLHDSCIFCWMHLV